MNNIVAFSLLIFLNIQVQAQPGDRGETYAAQVYREASQEVPPYSNELYSNLIKSREQLAIIKSTPSMPGHGTIKVAYYTYAIQSMILKHLISIEQNFKAEKELFVHNFKKFYLFETDNIEWKDKKKETRKSFDFYMQSELAEYNKAGIPYQFLENSENRSWYETTIGELDLNQLLDSIYTEQDLATKLILLKNTTIDVNSFCRSIYSSIRCSVIDDYIIKIETEIQEQKEIDSINYIKREFEIAIRQRKIDSVTTIIENADSLFELGVLIKAKELYETTNTFYFKGNQSLTRLKEIEKALDLREENKFKSNIYRTFLFDSLGRLRIDTTKSILPAELKQIKDNRALISAQIIAALQDYDSYLMKYEFEKNQYDVLKLLPYQIKDTTEHLYNITCDSSGILKIEHKLLSSNQLYGTLSDSIIRKAISSIFPYLKINDGEIHEYLIPIIYIPSRHLNTQYVSYYCNCHYVGVANINRMNLSCNSNKISSSNDPSHVDFIKYEMNCILDEYYFVISDGYPISYGDNSLEKSIQTENIPRDKNKKRRTTRNK
jgi:hypothetical protein